MSAKQINYVHGKKRKNARFKKKKKKKKKLKKGRKKGYHINTRYTYQSNTAQHSSIVTATGDPQINTPLCNQFLLCNIINMMLYFLVDQILFGLLCAVFGLLCAVFGLLCAVFGLLCAVFGLLCAVFGLLCAGFTPQVYHTSTVQQSSHACLRQRKLPPFPRLAHPEMRHLEHFS